MKKQEETPEKNPKAIEVSDLPDKEFKETIIRMLNKPESTIEEFTEHFNKNKENVIENQLEVKHTITEAKTTSEGINSRLVNTEEQVSDLEDRIVEITQSEQQSEKRFFLK